jgi:N-acetylglutamate synthase-like GNAT family acetyltransferase
MTIKKRHSAHAASDINIRPFRENDIEFVISRQLSLYALEYGFTSEIWKTYLTCGVHSFVNQFDDKKDCMFILERDGVSSGCVAITHVDEVTAQLRFFFLEPEMRGWGAGRQLLERAIDFCKEKKYEHVFLWTFNKLMAARHLYASTGFQITETRVNNDWGKSILEERWDLDL